MIIYFLVKRLGISFRDVDYKVKEKIKIGIDEDYSVERWYGDLFNLKKYMDNRE